VAEEKWKLSVIKNYINSFTTANANIKTCVDKVSWDFQCPP